MNVARDMDTLTMHTPLGVTAGITPFNFPAMIPLWVSRVSSVACIMEVAVSCVSPGRSWPAYQKLAFCGES